MQQPQTRPLLGDSSAVSSTTSPTVRRNSNIHNPVTVLTAHQVQLQQLQQQLQQAAVQNNTCGNQSLTFALPSPQPPSSNNKHEQSNNSTAGNHIVYLNHQNTINSSGAGMGLPPPATPTFGVGINMGLPLSLLNTSRLTSFTSNVITTSNPLLNIGLPNPAVSAGGGGSVISGNNLTTPADFNTLNALNSTLNTNLSSNSISGCSNNNNNGSATTCVTGVVQDINIINSGINRLNHSLNHTPNINSSATGCLSAIDSNACSPTFTHFNSNLNQNFATINVSVTENNHSSTSGCNTVSNLNQHITSVSSQSSLSNQHQQVNQTLHRPAVVSALTSGFTCNATNSSVMASTANLNNTTTTTTVATSAPNNNFHHNLGSGGNDNSEGMSTISTTTPTISTAATNFSTSNDSGSIVNTLSHITSNIVSSTTHQQVNNTPAGCNVSTVQSNLQTQRVCSPKSPFSIPLKSPVSNMTAPPTPSPSPNRLLLQSPITNSIQSHNTSNNNSNNNSNNSGNNNTRHSPSPITSLSNTNFNMQLQQSPIYQSSSPMNIGQLQNSPVTSPYAPAKSPHHFSSSTTNINLNNNNNNSNRSPVPPAVTVRPNTPTIPIQQGMQVLQIIGTPQAYHQQTSSQLVTTRTHHNNHLFGNQPIQITTTKPPAKQPPQILPKPPANQQGIAPTQKQRVTTTITTNQATQPQFVLATASPQQNHPTATATVIPTAQGLFLNQVLPSTGPVIVQPQPGGLQLILRTPTNAQQQTHTAQLTTQQQLIRVVTAQGMQLQGITPTFFAVPNNSNFSSPVPSPITVTRHTPTTTTTTTTISPGVPANSNNSNNQILMQNTVIQNPPSQMNPQVNSSTPSSSSSSCPSISVSTTSLPSSNNLVNQQQQKQQLTVIDQNLLPPPKKKAKKRKKVKKKDEDPPKLDLASIMKISGIGDDDDMYDTDIVPPEVQETTPSRQIQTIADQSLTQTINHLPTHLIGIPQQSVSAVSTSSTSSPALPSLTPTTANLSQNSVGIDNIGNQLVAQLQVPVQNTISGQLRLTVSEDGKVILHHTPEPNQPEMDQATTQALIRSLTQGIQIAVGSTSPKPGQSTTVQNDQVGKTINQPSNIISQQQTLNMAMKKPTQFVLQNPLPNSNIRSNSVKSLTPQSQQFQQQRHQNFQQQTPGQLTTNTVINRQSQNVRTVSQQKNQQENNILQSTNEQINQQNIQQISHSIQSLNAQPQSTDQRLLEHFHKITLPNMQHNSFNTLQHNTPNASQLQIVQSNDNQIHQQQAINILTPEQGIIVEASQCTQQQQQQQHQQQQDFIKKEVMQQQQTQQQSVATINLPGQHQFYSLQKATLSNVPSSTNSLQYDAQKNSVVISSQPNVQQLQLQLPQQQQSQNIIFSNEPCIKNITTMTNETSHKLDTHQRTDLLNSAPPPTATNTINNAPKITPEILSALSNLNPNDQLLIANANGQMQVISQQFLQQLLTGQINSSPRQNQTQKIVIGSSDGSYNNNSGDTTSHANSQGLHGIQINAPTGQIIVNSSGGAPTIQNNIQNIVVQAAPPSQLHHSFPIHNSSFPGQFIDNFNQQQLKNLSNNTTTTTTATTATNNSNINNNNIHQQVPSTKKTKVVKRTKVVLTVDKNIGFVHGTKSNEIVVNHPSTELISKSTAVTTATITTAATTTSLMTPITSTNFKTDNVNKLIINDHLSSSNSSITDKNDTIQIVENSMKNMTSQQSHIISTSIVPSSSSLSPPTSTPLPLLKSTSPQAVQKQRKYIQLPLEKQQMLKNIQSRIHAILERKTLNNQNEQSALTVLCQEHHKIVASGKVISAPTLSSTTTTITTLTSTPVTAALTTTTKTAITSATLAVAATTTAISASQCNTLKLTGNKTQIPVSQIHMINTSINNAAGECINNEKSIGNDSDNNSITSIITTTSQNNSNCNLPYIINHNKQQKLSQVHSNRPSALNVHNFSSPNVHSLTSMHSSMNVMKSEQQQHSTNVTCTQQSIQCQTDEIVDIKPNIELISTVKQELLSPIQLQTTSPMNHQIISPIEIENSITLNNTNNSKNIRQFENLIANTLCVTPSTTTTTSTVITSTATTSTSTTATIAVTTSPKQGVKRPATSPIFRQVNRIDLFEKQLKIDQNDATKPDMNTPFSNKRNACKRLLKYHCFNEQVLSIKDLAKADELFEETAKHLLGKFHSMMNKYTYLLLMESMREVRTSELMMIDRTFVAEEQNMLNRLREQEAKANEELKKEEKPLFPKVEAEMMSDMKNLGPVDPIVPPSLLLSSSSSSSTSSSSSLLSNIIVKKELEDDFTNIDAADSKLNIKPSNCTSSDYDEWLEIQKELGVYPTCRDSSSKTKSFNCTTDITSDVSVGDKNSSGNNNISVIGTIPKVTKMPERIRINGECRSGANSNNCNNSSNNSGSSSNNNVSNSAMTSVHSLTTSIKDVYESDSIKSETTLEKYWCSEATDLERDLLEDTDSLDGLTALQSAQIQQQQSQQSFCEHDDITAQVQSAIDSILNLKKRPSSSVASNNISNSSTNSNSSSGSSSNSNNNSNNNNNNNNGQPLQSGDSKDSVLDQAVQSILGS